MNGLKGPLRSAGMKVTFPDGTTALGSALRERELHSADRDFGLYMDARWAPTWPHTIIDWKDFGLPADPDAAAAAIADAFERARSGVRVEVGCAGGLGRTGTVLACMAVLAGVAAPNAVQWVRDNYSPGAVETLDQRNWVEEFASKRAPK